MEFCICYCLTGVYNRLSATVGDIFRIVRLAIRLFLNLATGIRIIRVMWRVVLGAVLGEMVGVRASLLEFDFLVLSFLELNILLFHFSLFAILYLRYFTALGCKELDFKN